MRRIFSCLAAIFFLISPTFADSKLKIGFPLPLTGEAASFGAAIRNGVNLALEAAAEKNLEVLFEDDQYIPAKTVSSARKLIEANGVEVLLSVGSTPSHAVAPITESKHIPLFAWASDATVAEGKRFTIRTYPSSTEEGGGIADEALKRGYNKVALFYSQNDYTQAVRKAVFDKLGKERILYEEELPIRVPDFVPSLLKTKGADSYFICFTPGNSGVFAKQLRKLHITAPIFGCEALNDDAEVKTAEGALKGAWFVTNGVSDEFRKLYIERFKNENLVAAAALHYDIIKTLSKLHAQGFKGEGIIDSFLKLGLQGEAVPGWTPQKTEKDQFVKFPFIIKNCD